MSKNRHYDISRRLLQDGVNHTKLTHDGVKTLPQNFISYTYTYAVCIGYTYDVNSIVPVKRGGKHPSRTDK
jgi:hypothetical protein